MSTLGRFAAAAAVAALAGAGLGRLVLRQPQAPLDGVESPPGVKTDVEIVRDKAGVPHVYAATSFDLYYALGYVHAQDRLWQMELNRRVARGRLAEIFGEVILGFDRFMRRIGLSEVAIAEAAALEPDERVVLAGYAAGVNGFLETHRHRLPIEFRILRFRPEPWDPADSLAWGKLMAWQLSANWDTEWFRARLIDQIGPEAAAALELGYPKGHPITTEPGTSYAGLSDSLVAEFLAGQRALNLFAGGMSNAWAVAPDRSATGSALLASDPHLRPQMPSIWYEAHLSGDGLDVVGATMPGLPSILIGHNQHLAWGITASMVDTQDLYLERLKPDDPHYYETPNGWEPIAIRREAIQVRGRAEPVVEEVQVTRHGPSLTPLLSGETRMFAIQSTILRPGHAVRGSMLLNRARNWDEFQAALADFDVALNFVYADCAGNIGYQLSGRVPRRSNGSGLVPAPGWDASYDWDGYVPAAEMPSVFNPPCGYVVSANNRIDGEAYGHHLSHDWCDGFRALGIEKQLAARERHTLDDFAAMQRDFTSEAARQLVALLADLEPPPGEPRVTRALEYLRRWDCRLTAESVAASIYVMLRQRLLKNIFGPGLGPLAGAFTGTAAPSGIAGSVYSARASGNLIEVLRSADPAWLPADGRFATWADLEWTSLTEAVQELRERLGDDMDTWRWGSLHQIRFDHPLGRVKPLDRIFCRGPYPLGGDGDTPHQASSIGGGFGADEFIPSYRQIVDLGDWSNSRSIHTTGQSGQVGSRHYDDFIPLWRAGRYHPMLYDRRAILDDLEHLLLLRPKEG
jgi:penicillin amidase